MSVQPIPPAIAKIAPDGNLTPRQLRRFMIDMVMRRVKPGTGSGYDFLRRRTAMNPWPDLRQVLQGINWMIIGGVATRAYMAERMTKDLDIIVDRRDQQAVIENLEHAGYRMVARRGNNNLLLFSPEGVEIDVHLGNSPWLKVALTNPASDPAGYPVVTLPYLAILKMAGTRMSDWADISRMLGWASDAELDAVRIAIKKYAPDDLEDLESLIFLGKKEQEIPPSDE
jgi:hypothetical protein